MYDNDWINAFEAQAANDSGVKQTWATPADLAMALDESYKVRAHLKYLSDRLAKAITDVENGRSRYITISMPPRLGKSFLTSVYFPLFVLHKHPEWELMLLSHDPSLATGWGRQIRNTVEERGGMLDLQISKDAGAVREWETSKSGGVLSRSIRESVTGRGAKVMILDDVVKDFADAHSETNREFIWNWWTANSRTRLHPPALVVVIGTRWHEDDIIGRLLSTEYDGNPAQWEVISFPALAEENDVLGRSPGEPLLSPIVDEDRDQAIERWEDIKQAVGTYAWAALFQQAPSPAKGSIFDSDWWQYWRTPSDLPVFERVFTSWDCAFKNTSTSDWVVGQCWGVCGANRYLLKQTRKRLSFTETLGEMRDFIKEAEDEFAPNDGIPEHLVEDKANGTAVIDVLRTTIPGMIPINPTDSKEARARSISPIIEAGNVFIPALAPWVKDFVGEHKAFPNDRNDDQVDCTSQALRRARSSGPTTAHVSTATVHRGYTRSGVGRRR